MVTRRWNSRDRVQSEVSGESKTKQSHRESVDINNIIAQFDRTGQLPQARRQPQYGDVSGMNADLTELVQNSRETLDTAGQFLDGYQPDPEPTPTIDQPESDSAQDPPSAD